MKQFMIDYPNIEKMKWKIILRINIRGGRKKNKQKNQNR